MSRTYSRAPLKDQSLRNSGPYEAIIVNHHDPMSMGSLEVEIIRYGGAGNNPTRTGQLVTAKYLSPFYGVTPVAGLSNNDTFHQTQKSYGFWMIPPDIGTRVLVIFAEGDPVNAYWIGCIQDTYMNFMVPDGKAATELTTNATPENLKGLKLPVGEYSKVNESGTTTDSTLFAKPYNKDFSEILEIQGLLLDEARGLTTSSARRETPSSVFGVSTPGPLDKRQLHPTTKYGPDESAVDIPFNRLGGSSFVMDDGDDKFIRATHPADGPPLYVNKEKGEPGGDETIPQNECIRIRTRTGHQILLHNSEDLIYITNSRGTAWIELTSDGKIDIHAEDSVSIHTEQDFNFRAERDVNIEAGRNINMRASANWSDDLPTLNGYNSGNIQMESRYDVSMKGGRSAIFDTADILDLHIEKGIRLSTNGDINLSAKQNINTRAEGSVNEQSGKSWYRKAGTTLTDQVEGSYFTQVGGSINVNSNSSIYETARTDKHVFAKTIYSNAKEGFNVQAGVGFSLDSPKVDLNGSSSSAATTAPTYTTPDAAGAGPRMVSAMSVEPTQMTTNTTNGSTENITTFAAAAEGDYIGPGGHRSSDAPETSLNSPTPPAPSGAYQGIGLHPLPRMRPGMVHPTIFDSIMKRVPQHEPWTHHENYDPRSFRPEFTDATVFTEYLSVDRVLTPDTFMKNKVGRSSSSFVAGSGGMSTSSAGGMVPASYGAASGSYGAAPSGPMPSVVNESRDPLPPGTNAFTQSNVDGPLATIKTKSGLSTTVALVFQGNFQGFINDLEATGYQIKSLGGYNRRKRKLPGGGDSGDWSYHALGAAIDINPSTNGFFVRSSVGGKTVTDMPIDTVKSLCIKWGIGWGGNWTRTTDAMHFSAGEGGSFKLDSSYGRVPLPPATGVADNKTNVA